MGSVEEKCREEAKFEEDKGGIKGQKIGCHEEKKMKNREKR